MEAHRQTKKHELCVAHVSPIYLMAISKFEAGRRAGRGGTSGCGVGARAREYRPERLGEGRQTQRELQTRVQPPARRCEAGGQPQHGWTQILRRQDHGGPEPDGPTAASPGGAHLRDAAAARAHHRPAGHAARAGAQLR